MKISFLDFWDGFDAENNFLIDLIRSFKYDVYISEPHQADLIIFSCFGNSNKQFNHCKKIFYTGENLRPNFNDCDYSLTFDFDDYDGKNIRLPLWLMQIDFFNKKSYGNPKFLINLKTLLDNEENPYSKIKKENFCVIVNNHLGNKREEILRCLIKNKHKQVNGYGKIFNNWFYGEDTKLDILSKFKFNICFENSIHSGYYTEKLIHAKAAFTIPVYYSDSNIEKDFNKNSFLNLNDYESMEHFCDRILEIDSNESLYKDIVEQPLFNKPDHAIQLLSDISYKISKIL
jgi:hypothetical protein